MELEKLPGFYCVPAELLPAGSRWPFCSREVNLWPTSCPVSSSFLVQLWPVSLLAAYVQFAPWNSDLTCRSKCYRPGRKSNRLVFLHPKRKDDSIPPSVWAITKKAHHTAMPGLNLKNIQKFLCTHFSKKRLISNLVLFHSGYNAAIPSHTFCANMEK